MAEDKMENGYELWLKCCDNTKSGEVKRFLEVPYSRLKKIVCHPNEKRIVRELFRTGRH